MSDILGRLTLRQLRYFMTVAELRSFRQGASRLNMSQPPLTQAMQLLEETLGVELFEREGRGIRLTPAAEELLQGSKQVFELATRVVERVRDVGGGAAPRLLLGLTDDFIFSPMLADLLAGNMRGERLSLDTTIGLSGDLLRQVRDNVVDLAMTVSAHAPPKDIVAMPLGSSRIMALVPVDHPLCGEVEIAPATLVRESLILMPDDWRSPFAEQCTKIFAECGDAHGANRTTNSTLVQSLVEQGRGIGVVSEYSVRDTRLSRRIPIRSRHALLKHALIRLKSASRHVLDMADRIAGDR